MALALINSLLHQDTALAEELYATLTHPELRENAAPTVPDGTARDRPRAL